jgi:hypothetical protein
LKLRREMDALVKFIVMEGYEIKKIKMDKNVTKIKVKNFKNILENICTWFKDKVIISIIRDNFKGYLKCLIKLEGVISPFK